MEEGEGDRFDRLMAATDPAMVVVTTVAAGERAGCLVGFHAQASIDPEQYAVWLSKANHTYRVARDGALLAVHLLAEADLGIAEHFGGRTGDREDKFAGVRLDQHRDDVPLLAACPNRMVLEKVRISDTGGDHVCLVGGVVSAESADEFEPLRLSACQGIAPGHANDD